MLSERKDFWVYFVYSFSDCSFVCFVLAIEGSTFTTLSLL